MSDVSDSEGSPKKGVELLKIVEDGDGSKKKQEVLAVYRLTSSDAMLIKLRAKSKLPFIDGSLEKLDEDDPLRERWEVCNATVLAWIFNTLEKDLQATAAYAVDAKCLWDDLKERFSQGNQTRIYQIKSEICVIKQEGQSVQDYYDKLKTLWDELEFYLESPGCSCGANGRIIAQRGNGKGVPISYGAHFRV
ncbi:hypothetical protein CRG98_012447 [Punica granatum]|uniref:Uncharacterized protein n=1 Tax=Punica granatum TaxID=22663 RepID=A0A2I0KFE0_PUNGR|nr:hypothetical protein CRG98_012447 [Punica granatum]